MVTGVIATATLTIALSTRGMFETDQHRTTVNQNLRAGIDLLGIDVRQAGERLTFDAPAVQIVDGSGGASDTLVLRRNMLDYVLPVCKDILGGKGASLAAMTRARIDPRINRLSRNPGLNGTLMMRGSPLAAVSWVAFRRFQSS